VSISATSGGERADSARARRVARLESQERRARIDAQAGVWLAGALFAGAALALLDRVGAPKALCAALATLTPALGAAALGVAAASARGSGFHFAFQAVSAPYAALTWLAGLAAAAGLTTLAAPTHVPSSALAMLAAMILLAPLAGALARRSGAVSAADLVARRFDSTLARRAAAIPALATGVLLLLAGLSAAAAGLEHGAGLSRGAALALAAVVCALAVAPGGLRGASLVTAALASVGLAAIAAAFFFARSALSDAIGEPPAALFAQGGLIDDGLALGGALARGRMDGLALLGGAGLAVGLLLGPFGFTPAAGAPDAREARRAGFALWPLAGAATLGALAFAALAAPPGAADWAEATAAALELFTAPDLSGAPRGFAAAGASALGLALAVLGAQGVAAAGGRDPLFDLRDAGALSGRSLGAARLAVLACVGLAAGALALTRAHGLVIEPTLALTEAAAVSLAGLAPPVALAFSRRANALDAAMSALAGLAAFVVASAAAAGPTRMAHIGAAALAGAAAGWLAGFAASRLRPPDPREARRAKRFFGRGD
jgi:Na+/proline symporter